MTGYLQNLICVEGWYRCEDVRGHVLKRTGGYKELPEYYLPYLDRKADEIARLKAEEASGFFFWTDTHFPDNAGNAAAILEYMQKKLGPCMLFNGGDVALNADRLAPGIEANTSSWLQADLCRTLLPIRGNHDYTFSTSVNVKSPETMSDAQVNGYLSSFLSHVPLAADHSGDRSLVAVGKKIAALAESRSVLMALCGHRHSDVESGIGSLFQVITAGDCLVDMGRIRTPYS